MRLPPQQVERFFGVWFALLRYVNEQKQIVPSSSSTWKIGGVPLDVAFPVREALWEDDSLRRAFIAENPAKLAQDDLALVESWQHRVQNSFYIFRHLKKYTVFLLADSPARAYGVLGLKDPLDEMTGGMLPLYVEAVLLPFEGQIITDGLIAPYNIYFGGGIRSDLNASYQAIQEREGVITALPFSEAQTLDKKTVVSRNKKTLTAFQKHLGQSGLSPKMMEEHTGVIQTFAQSFLAQQKPPRLLIDVTVADLKAYLPQAQSVNTVSFKRFVQFLRDTWRVDWDEAEDMLRFIKTQKV